MPEYVFIIKKYKYDFNVFAMDQESHEKAVAFAKDFALPSGFNSDDIIASMHSWENNTIERYESLWVLPMSAVTKIDTDALYLEARERTRHAKDRIARARANEETQREVREMNRLAIKHGFTISRATDSRHQPST